MQQIKHIIQGITFISAIALQFPEDNESKKNDAKNIIQIRPIDYIICNATTN
jgi:hypothetical protein